MIPTENPQLEVKTYTKMLEHLYGAKEYEKLKEALGRYPRYIVNHEHLLVVISESIKRDEAIAQN